jgi:hypothetical protein
MPRHSKKSEAISSAAASEDHIEHRVHHSKKVKSGKHMDVPNAGKPSSAPQATSAPGGVHIIHDVMKAGRGAHGIPGIISSTTLGNEVRQRLMTGIIDSPGGESRHAAVGPVQRVMGIDSTAYNAGMAHIAGSPYK